MIIVEDNYSVSVEEAQNIVASWIDLWLEFCDEKQNAQTDNSSAA